MPAPDSIKRLVDYFDQNRSSFLSPHYKEAQLRQDFLNPFFIALGWDLFNENHFAEAYRDVVIESSVEVEGAAKAPDYSFRVGGNRKFFVEAKKPSVNIEFDIHPAFQVRRYAWSAKLPLSILTDFEEFAVYDCRTRPDKSDKAATGRVKLLNYKDYLTRWDEIADTFSKDAVLHGKFDQFAEAATGKRGTQEVDDAFLQEIEKWRDLLARNLALRNPGLSTRELNYAVQMTIDRIIFLRICEDRQIEPEDRLKDICSGEGIYPELVNLFRQADSRYNSGLFHFNIEKTQSSSPDDLTPTLSIDDKVLKEIVSSLYYPCPYVFRVLPVEILGQVYERFLGKVIRLTAGHQAKVEEKPEVRKAGGVYYTPTYIVDYIVKNTVGKLLENKTPAQAASLKIVDPACGSGSFLLGAYQYLLDWHTKWYSDNQPEKWAKGKSPVIYQAQGGWRLTTAEKKEILLNNIHGVDIDPQAVEVTKLSLSLKVLEGESQETLNSQLSLFKERALPDLGKNIQCGNTLIGSNYNEGKLFTDEEEHLRVNPFDWQDAFPQVFAQGGFDAVIGNPPYVRQEVLSDLKDYFRNKYKTFHGIADLYVYFIEKGISLLRETGIFSYIVSNKWMRTNYGVPLRKWILQQGLREILDFNDLKVFQNVTTYPCIITVVKRSKNDSVNFLKIDSLSFSKLEDYVKEKRLLIINIKELGQGNWSFESNANKALLDQIKVNGLPLEDYLKVHIYRGIITGLNEAFVIDESTKNRIIKENPSSKEIIKPFLIGRDIKRYKRPINNSYLIFMPKGWTRKISGGAKDPWSWLSNKFPAISSHLEPFFTQATKRCDQGDYWWELRACDYYPEFEKSKIVYPNICKQPEFTIDYSKSYTNQKCFIIPVDDKYLLGILNSKVFKFLFTNSLPKLRGGFFEPSFVYFRRLPVPKVNTTNPSFISLHKNLVAKVDQMSSLSNKNPKTPQEKVSLQRELATIDKQIDNLVYHLYGLTPEEIKIVEGT
jgi:type I restriction-modification system DNA methylase subunit